MRFVPAAPGFMIVWNEDQGEDEFSMPLVGWDTDSEEWETMAPMPLVWDIEERKAVPAIDYGDRFEIKVLVP